MEVLDLQQSDTDLKGFIGGFAAGGYGYAVPHYSGGYYGKVARFDLSTFSEVTVLDLMQTNSDLSGFKGGFAVGGYGYVVPNYKGKLARFDLATFSEVGILDLTTADSDLVGCSGGFASNGYAYILDGGSEYSGKLARFPTGPLQRREASRRGTVCQWFAVYILQFSVSRALARMEVLSLSVGTRIPDNHRGSSLPDEFSGGFAREIARGAVRCLAGTHSGGVS